MNTDIHLQYALLILWAKICVRFPAVGSTHTNTQTEWRFLSVQLETISVSPAHRKSAIIPGWQVHGRISPALCSAVLFRHQFCSSSQHPGILSDHLGDRLKENSLFYGVIFDKRQHSCLTCIHASCSVTITLFHIHPDSPVPAKPNHLLSSHCTRCKWEPYFSTRCSIMVINSAHSVIN